MAVSEEGREPPCGVGLPLRHGFGCGSHRAEARDFGGNSPSPAYEG